jgi:hypothetical protein
LIKAKYDSARSAGGRTVKLTIFVKLRISHRSVGTKISMGSPAQKSGANVCFGSNLPVPGAGREGPESLRREAVIEH